MPLRFDARRRRWNHRPRHASSRRRSDPPAGPGSRFRRDSSNSSSATANGADSLHIFHSTTQPGIRKNARQRTRCGSVLNATGRRSRNWTPTEQEQFLCRESRSFRRLTFLQGLEKASLMAGPVLFYAILAAAASRTAACPLPGKLTHPVVRIDAHCQCGNAMIVESRAHAKE